MKDIAVFRCLALAGVLAGSARALAGEDLGAWQPLPKEFQPAATSETRVSLHQGNTWAYLRAPQDYSNLDQPSGEDWHVRLFRDGRQVAEGTSTNLPSGSTIPDSLILGAELFYLHDAYSRGLLSESLVIGRALNPEELRAPARP